MKFVFALIASIFIGFGIGALLDTGERPRILTYEQMIESKKADCLTEGGKVEYFSYYHKVYGGYQKSVSFVCRK